MVLVGNQYSERRAGRGAKELVYELRGQDKGDIVWVDGDARTVSLKEPLRVAFFFTMARLTRRSRSEAAMESQVR